MGYLDWKKPNTNNSKRGYYNAGKFIPKKPVRSFRDLEVYQKTMECSVLINKDILPTLVNLKDENYANLSKNAMSIPLYIAEAHSLRFADFKLALGYVEKALAECNRMSVYLDHIKGLYGTRINNDLIEDLIGKYSFVRQKIFRLEQSWKKFMKQDNSPNQQNQSGYINRKI